MHVSTCSALIYFINQLFGQCYWKLWPLAVCVAITRCVAPSVGTVDFFTCILPPRYEISERLRI